MLSVAVGALEEGAPFAAAAAARALLSKKLAISLVKCYFCRWSFWVLKWKLGAMGWVVVAVLSSQDNARSHASRQKIKEVESLDP